MRTGVPADAACVEVRLGVLGSAMMPDTDLPFARVLIEELEFIKVRREKIFKSPNPSPKNAGVSWRMKTRKTS